ncbi:MAG: DUF4097 family beta strand repeat-containing protein [Opitutus sp.]
MKPVRFYSPFLLSAALAVTLLTAARAEDNDTSSIKFSNPGQPGTLKVTVTNGDIHIRGVDAPDVTVRTELRPEGHGQRDDGLRVLTSSSSYSLTEKENVVTLSYGADSWPGNGGDFDITVPHNTNIVISSALGGDITIGEVSGDLEVKSLNGEVKLRDVAGGALVETMNGEIKADVTQMKDGKPLSFTSMNGEVALRLPKDIKANVRLRTHNGSILTDFDDKQLVTKTASLRNRHGPDNVGENQSDDVRATVRDAVRMGIDAARQAANEAARGAREAMREANRNAHNSKDHAREDEEDATPAIPTPPMPPLPPMTGGKIVTGTLNGGGPEIRVATMNGDVTLRKAETAK